jgi:hypothetical protein
MLSSEQKPEEGDVRPDESLGRTTEDAMKYRSPATKKFNSIT